MAELAPADRLAAMRERLVGDSLYADEYARFVGGMAFTGESEVPDFDVATAAVDRLCARLA